MVSIPSEPLKLLNDPKSIKIVSTKTEDGNVHAIHVGSVTAPDPSTIAFGAILMKKTGKNLENMKRKSELASVLIVKERSSFEIRASVKDYQMSGPLFDKMNEDLKKIGLAARGVWLLEPKDVWDQSASYEAGKRLV